MAVTIGTKLSGEQKAAILLISLGPEISSEVFKELKEEYVEQVALQIANMKRVTPGDRDSVMEETFQLSMADEYISAGGVDYAREVLEKALGEQRAIEIINRLQGALQMSPFDFIKRTDPQQLLNFIQNEHPQTISLILAHLNAEHAATILAALPPEIQVDVAQRIAVIERATPDIIMEIEKVLERNIASVFTQEMSSAGGVRAVAEMLNRVDRSTEKAIMEKLEEANPDLADEIKRLMFVFDDVLLIDDKSIQRILREVDQKDLILALKGAGEEVKAKILKNMSQRARALIVEEMEVMGPTRLKNTEEAQQKIVNTIRQLEEMGEIVVARGGEEEVFV
ncbi:MAG TPA: flagellar motor switch protein FliG [bacterium]|jgi:flagellar motor switch protein FliG|nr:flagellar motor switch protein FliG [bacterium]